LAGSICRAQPRLPLLRSRRARQATPAPCLRLNPKKIPSFRRLSCCCAATQDARQIRCVGVGAPDDTRVSGVMTDAAEGALCALFPSSLASTDRRRDTPCANDVQNQPRPTRLHNPLLLSPNLRCAIDPVRLAFSACKARGYHGRGRRALLPHLLPPLPRTRVE